MAKQPLPDISAKSSAADRLGQALTLLTQRKSNLDEPQQATVAELCRLAGVSRNSLYRYHSETLKALRKFQCRRPTRQDFSATRTVELLRTENASLHKKIAKLAGLVDHYYSAYREVIALLERRDRELAAVRRRLDIKPVVVKH
jgi:AcrR family transcriptional regulator